MGSTEITRLVLPRVRSMTPTTVIKQLLDDEKLCRTQLSTLNREYKLRKDVTNKAFVCYMDKKLEYDHYKTNGMSEDNLELIYNEIKVEKLRYKLESKKQVAFKSAIKDFQRLQVAITKIINTLIKTDVDNANIKVIRSMFKYDGLPFAEYGKFYGYSDAIIYNVCVPFYQYFDNTNGVTIMSHNHKELLGHGGIRIINIPKVEVTYDLMETDEETN